MSINYRLGPLGFMALDSAGIYGNQGIQDLLLGLEWVQTNIAAFGGDPVYGIEFDYSLNKSAILVNMKLIID